jgi:hypothetical protein
MRLWKRIFLVVLIAGIIFYNDNNEKQIYDNVFLVYEMNGQMPMKSDIVFLRKGDSLKIYPVGVIDNQYYCEVDDILIDGKKIRTYPIKGRQLFNLYGLQPILREYDNVEGATKDNIVTYKESISYTYTKIDKEYIQGIMEKKDYGTHYITIRQEHIPVDSTLSSTGAIHKEYDNILQIVYRPDDTYIGYLFEMFHTPFIMAPKSVQGKYHQTDERIGSDCAELAIYGMRRLGYLIPYCGPKKIYSYTNVICDRSTLGHKHKVYVDGKKHKIPVNTEGGIYPGDILHFGVQVSVFYKDEGIIGYLDCQDILIQSYGVTPNVTTIKDSGFKNYSFKILRFKKE